MALISSAAVATVLALPAVCPAPAAICCEIDVSSAEAEESVAALSAMSLIIACSPPRKVLNQVAISPTSSRVATSRRWVRSPSP